MNILKKSITIFVLLTTSITYASCSTDDSVSDGESKGSGSYPLTVTTQSTTTTLNERPSRIATLSNDAFENVVSLNFTPVLSVVNSDFDKAEYYDEWSNEPYIDRNISSKDGEEFYEAIAKSEPDLIVAPGWDQYKDSSVIESLQKIAPTIVYDLSSSDEKWREGFGQIADLLDSRELANKLISDYNSKIDHLPTEFKGKSYSFGAAMASGDIILVATADTLFEKLGFTKSLAQSEVDPQNSGTGKYSSENYSKIDGDVIVLTARGADQKEFSESPAFRTIADRVTWDDRNISYSITSGGIIGQTWAIDELPSLLTR